MDAMCRTGVIRTSRDKSLIHPVITEIALLRDGFIFIKPNGIIRT